MSTAIRLRSFLLVVLLASLLAPSVHAQALETEVRALREEVRQLREELNALRSLVQGPDASDEPSPAAMLPVIQAQIQEHAQTKVESNSRFPVKLFGEIVSNSVWNTGEVNWLDLPNVVTPDPADLPAGSFTSTLRQSRVGAIIQGPEIGGMQSSGFFAMDFFGGVSRFSTGQTMGIPRLLYAYMRVDGESTSVQIGQDHMILGPRNPTSLGAESFPMLYRSGNLYLRVPQLRVEHTIRAGDLGEFRAVGGVVAPVAGDFASDAFEFVPPNLAGERSKTPGVQARLSLRAAPAGPHETPAWEFGASGHYSRERYASGIAASWAGAFDFDVTEGRFGAGGELFIGRNIDAFGGSIAQNAKSRGGFLEGRYRATRRLTFNGGYGTDRLFDRQSFAASLSHNSSLFGNTIYEFTPEFQGSFEYRWLATRPAAMQIRRNNQFNLTFVYRF